MKKWLVAASVVFFVGMLAVAVLLYMARLAPLSVKRYEVGLECRYSSSYLQVDYPVGGPSGAVRAIRQWIADSLCSGGLADGENPIALCLGACRESNVREIEDEYGEYADELGMSFDTTYVDFLSETKSTVTYQVRSYSYNYGAAHGQYSDPIFVLVKGRASPLAFEDVFAVSRAKVLDLVRRLAKTEPSNQHECGAKGIEKIDHLFPTKDGLAFHWHTYAVNCGACGNVVLTLPYEKFEGLFRAEFEKLLPEFGYKRP